MTAIGLLAQGIVLFYLCLCVWRLQTRIGHLEAWVREAGPVVGEARERFWKTPTSDDWTGG